MQVTESEKYILWVDDSEETNQAKIILKSKGIDFEERVLDQAEPYELGDCLKAPTLQTFQYRYLGLSTIKGFCQYEMQESEIIQFQAKIECEDQMRERFPNGIGAFWPTWSPRFKKATSV